MDLDCRQSTVLDRVSKGIADSRQTRRVQDDPFHFISAFLNLTNQITLMVGLKERKFAIQIRGLGGHAFVDLIHHHDPILGSLSAAEHVDIRALQN
jgi:hypothetical protein